MRVGDNRAYRRLRIIYIHLGSEFMDVQLVLLVWNVVKTSFVISYFLSMDYTILATRSSIVQVVEIEMRSVEIGHTSLCVIKKNPSSRNDFPRNRFWSARAGLQCGSVSVADAVDLSHSGRDYL